MNKIKVPLLTVILLGALVACIYSSSRHDWFSMGGWGLSVALVLTRYGK